MKQQTTVCRYLDRPGNKLLESRMHRKAQVRFGGGLTEKAQQWDLAGSLPCPELRDGTHLLAPGEAGQRYFQREGDLALHVLRTQCRGFHVDLDLLVGNVRDGAY